MAERWTNIKLKLTDDERRFVQSRLEPGQSESAYVRERVRQAPEPCPTVKAPRVRPMQPNVPFHRLQMKEVDRQIHDLKWVWPTLSRQQATERLAQIEFLISTGQCRD